MRRTLFITTAIALSALTLAGCSAGVSTVDTAESQEYLVDQASDGRVTEGANAPIADGTAFNDTVMQDTEREVITTGYMSVTVEAPDDATADAIRITESVGGRVDGRNEYAPHDGDRGSSTLTLRIPASDLTATLDKFKELGTLHEVSINAVDVTMESRDLEARITALDASVERLLALLTKAEDTETLIQLETAISGRQGELESLKSQKRYFDDQVAMSTITLSLISVADAPSIEPDSFLDGLIAGWAGFVAFFAGLLVLVGVLVPWLILGAVVAGVIVMIVRSRRQRRRPAAPAREE
ncbi:DUF4349 domain-containing protein [Salinibacterium sp. PAMC 21357]|uniref:DUF4349 domain-containing protein n=1 Tax=Salinibacterium sp. PAMC 21357 TaxID=1112215 RepID=UPI0009DA65BA|nr:DUF4349 domain-containing protein [Salinibacterium sp. PAMC 21357]